MSLHFNESLESKQGFEFLTYFNEGDSNLPLIIFFPGWGHLARIAYGGANIPVEEFLAHAFREQDYPFLAISYPLENSVYSAIYPQLQIVNWAQGAASIAQDILSRYDHPYLIAIHWSASGQLVTSFKKATQALGLLQPFSVSLEATPPILISPERTAIAEILENGLASVKSLYPNWLKQLNHMMGRELDLETYEENFLGAFPICLLGTPLVYKECRIEEDYALALEDRRSFQYAESPLVVSITGNSQEAHYHPLIDRATWSFINERKIYHAYLAPFSSQINQLSDSKWDDLQIMIYTFNQKMMHTVEGNHFLFIGQNRTRKIVHIIKESGKTIFEFKKNLADFFQN